MLPIAIFNYTIFFLLKLMKNAFSLIFERNCETYSTVQLHTFAIAFMLT